MKSKQIQSQRDGQNAREGFSFIEMLVMIIALGILLVLLLPSFRGVRSASRQIGCSIQLKRIDDGLNQYADENEGQYTIAGGLVPWEQVDPETNMPSWMQQVVPYISSKKTFAGCGAYPLDSPYHYFLGARAAYIDSGGGFAAVQRDKVRFADSFVLSGDNNYNRFSDMGPVVDADKDDYTFLTQVFSAGESNWAPHHDGMLNTAFADGHVAVFDQFDPDRMTYRYETMSSY